MSVSTLAGYCPLRGWFFQRYREPHRLLLRNVVCSRINQASQAGFSSRPQSRIYSTPTAIKPPATGLA